MCVRGEGEGACVCVRGERRGPVLGGVEEGSVCEGGEGEGACVCEEGGGRQCV